MELTFTEPSKKRKSKQEEEDQTKTGINNLPREIKVDIISRLPVMSLMQFRCVSRDWKALSHDPQLIKLHLTRTTKDGPCLIFHCDYPIQNQLYFVDFADQDDGEKAKKIDTPFSSTMPEFHIIGSCNGLLCLSDSLYNDTLYIYNPFTRDYKELPKSKQFQEQEVVFGFGFNLITNEHKVIKVIYYRNVYNEPWHVRSLRIPNFPKSDVQILRLSGTDTTWRSIGKCPYYLERRSSEALVNGRLHWVSQPRRHLGAARTRAIVSFDLSDEKFREVHGPRCGALNKQNHHLTVLEGCLSAVVYCSSGYLEIWVMKEYGVKDAWIKEFKIEDCSPKFLKHDFQRPYEIWRNTLRGRTVRVLCLLKNGEILMEYRGGSLVCYDPENGTYRNLVFQGMPSLCSTVVHAGGLNWINNPISM